MPLRGFVRVRVEATTALDGSDVVYLYLDGYRLEMSAPSGERARKIAWELVTSLGLDNVDG